MVLSRHDSPRPLTMRHVCYLCAGLFVGTLPQFASSTYYLGTPWANTYWGIPLAWDRPQFQAILFGASRGLFFWSPLSAIGVLGLVLGIVRKEGRAVAAVALTCLVVVTYILASWADVTFGCGFGHRMYVDAVPLIALGLGIVATNIARPIALTTAVGLTTLNVFLMVQYVRGEIPCVGTTPTVYREALAQPAYAVLGMRYGDSRESDGLAGEVRILGWQKTNSQLAIEVEARNVGTTRWRSSPGKGTVRLAVRVFGESGCEGTVRGEWRFPVPNDVPSNESVRLTANISTPTLPQMTEFLCVELMADRVAWFRDVGPSPFAVVRLTDR
jgi:hypothetical protein